LFLGVLLKRKLPQPVHDIGYLESHERFASARGALNESKALGHGKLQGGQLRVVKFQAL
jgi:hypothetical protein